MFDLIPQAEALELDPAEGARLFAQALRDSFNRKTEGAPSHFEGTRRVALPIVSAPAEWSFA